MLIFMFKGLQFTAPIIPILGLLHSQISPIRSPPQHSENTDRGFFFFQNLNANTGSCTH